MKYFFLRKIYAFFYWMADNASGSDIQVGFYRNFKKPSQLRNEELSSEIERLGEAMRRASEMRA